MNSSLVLIRHGETEWSRSGRHTGRSDVPLTDRGREQADRVGAALAGQSFPVVLCSPLQRARETARRSGLTGIEICSELTEWDYGDYEGRSTEDIRVDVPSWSVWTHPIRGGESAAEVGARADAVIARATAGAGPAVVFSHGHLLRILAARWLGLHALGGRLLALDTAAICVLGLERAERVIVRWNDTCHLGGWR